MEYRSRKVVEPDDDQKIKAWGLTVYGGMLTMAGGILAGERPAFILVAVLGFVAFIAGVRTMIQRSRRARTARKQFRDDER